MKRIAGLFTTLLLLMTLASCDSRKTAGENPFFTEWDTPHGVPPFPVREDKSVMAKTYHARAWHCSYSLLQLKGNFHLTKKQSENNAFNFANCLPDHNFPFSINKKQPTALQSTV